MRTSEERIEELHRRMKLRRKTNARRDRLTGAAAVAACLALALLIAVGVSRGAVQAPAVNADSVAASIFAEHGTLGFVLVALTAFCLGALVTVLCCRLKAHRKEEEQDNDRNR